MSHIFTLVRTGNHSLAEFLSAMIRGGETKAFARLVNVDEASFDSAWMPSGDTRTKLSFTDCTSLELMCELGIEQIASFDSGFDAFVERIY